MCDTDEHMLLGDTAAAWIPQMLQTLTGKLGHTDDYGASAIGGKNVFGQGGWFTDYAIGQFMFGTGTKDWASYGDILALSGDYFGSESAMINGVSTVEALLKAWHDKLKVPTSTLVDPDEKQMIVRAMENWPHFGFESVSMWLENHKQAIQIAISGRNGTFAADDISTKDQGFTPVTAALMIALRRNAFGDHYLSDLFSAGHMRVARLGLYDYINGGHPVRATSKWLIPFTSSFTDGKQLSDLASVLSGISHDEDGAFGLWCQLLFGGCKLNGLDGVRGISGHMSDPDNAGQQLATNWAGPKSGDVSDSFFARGDDGMSDPNAALNLDLCHYTIGLSIRDILIASITGKDPSDASVQSSVGYWDAVGGQPSPSPMYAALRLIPRPNDPADDWPSAPTSNFSGQKNHYPLLMPDYGLPTYYDNLKTQMTGAAFNRPASYTVRGATSSLTDIWSKLPTVSYSHGEYGPGVKDYIDYLDHLQNGDPSASLTGEQWRGLEYPRVLERYGRDKGPGAIAEYKEEAKRAIDAAQKKLADDAAALEKKALDAEAAAKQAAIDAANAAKARADQLEAAARQRAIDDANAVQKAATDYAAAAKQAALDQAAAMRARAEKLKSYKPSWL